MTRLRTHGKTETVEYEIWLNMKQRCLNKNHFQYKDYGGRGITVCKRWMKFENFIADVGNRPDVRLTLDRKDNSKGYYKSNVCWSTRRGQANNRRPRIGFIPWNKGKRLKT